MAQFAPLYSNEKNVIPMSSLDVDLDARLSIGDEGITGGGMAALHLGSNGYLDFANGSVGVLVANSFKAGPGSALSLDVIKDGEMDGFMVLGNAQGTLKLKNVNVRGELITDKDIGVYTKTDNNNVVIDEIYAVKKNGTIKYIKADGTETTAPGEDYINSGKYYGIFDEQNNGGRERGVK